MNRMSLENLYTFCVVLHGRAIMYSAQLLRISSAYSMPCISEIFLRFENSTPMTAPNPEAWISSASSFSNMLRFGIPVEGSK